VNILAIETSSEACSCALKLGDTSLSQRYQLAARQHTTLLLPMVESLLNEAGLALSAIDCFAFGRGPGSFTGVRIAASAIQGLALSVDRPVVAVSSLAVLAAAAGQAGESVLAAFDARMDEVYFAAYQLDAAGIPVAVQDEQLASPDSVHLPANGGWIAAGAGWSAYGERLAARLHSLGDAQLLQIKGDELPAAKQVALLADSPARAGLSGLNENLNALE
jgi:tRNA threonylcarbamoyladenosine biosynthesis protein TsaB